jgi:hypothetical protein
MAVKTVPALSPKNAIRTRPAGSLWALLLRSGLGLVLLLQTLGMWLNLRDVLGPGAIAPSSVVEWAEPWWQPRVGWFAPLLAHAGLAGQKAYVFCFALYTIFLVLLTLNFRPKLTSVFAFFLNLVIMGSSRFSFYGVEMLSGVGLFYCVLAPAKVQTQDNLTAWWSALLRKLFQFHMAVIYLTTGFVKAIGPQWWNGEAVWLASGMPALHGVIDVRPWLASLPALGKVAGISVLILEIGYPLFMPPKATRRIWLPLIIAMHLGIGIFLNLWTFALMMIVLNISAFASGYVARLLDLAPGIRRHLLGPP